MGHALPHALHRNTKASQILAPNDVLQEAPAAPACLARLLL